MKFHTMERPTLLKETRREISTFASKEKTRIMLG